MRECDRLRRKLAEYAVGRLRGRARARVADHVRVCGKCRAELAALERTGALLAAVRLEEAPGRTWEAVRRRMLAGERVGARPRLRWGWGVAAGAVALVLVLLGVVVMGPRRAGPPPGPGAVMVEADEEMEATMQGHLSAVWAAPLADEAAVGLRLAAVEDDG